MTYVSSFDELMARVRARDADAADQLVHQYERGIRLAVRLRLTDPRLRRQFDSMDICQSVFHSFFVRVAAGQYDLKDPQQLVALLMKMARNKFLMQVRRHHADGRDVRRLEAASDNMPSVRDGAPGPVRHAVGRELLDKLLKRLDPPERELAQRRAQGQEWKDIARELGGSAQTHRMRLSRAVDRVAADLGLDDGVFGEDDT